MEPLMGPWAPQLSQPISTDNTFQVGILVVGRWYFIVGVSCCDVGI